MRAVLVSVLGSRTPTGSTSPSAKRWGGRADGAPGGEASTEWHTPHFVVELTSGVVSPTAGEAGDSAPGRTGSDRAGVGTPVVSSATVSVPGPVTGLGSGVVAITYSGFDGCAYLDTGALKCWGNNLYGQLGDGSTTNRATPVDVSLG